MDNYYFGFCRLWLYRLQGIADEKLKLIGSETSESTIL